MRASINLATAPFIPTRRFLLTVGLLVGVTLVATLAVLVTAGGAWRERTATRARLRELTSERAELARTQQQIEGELQDPATRAVLERVRFLNGLVRQKNLSWTELVVDLQERLPPRVRILAVSPSLRDDGRLQVEMQVGGESPAAVIQFLRALEEGKKFQEIALHSQSRGTGAQADPVTAQVSVLYAQE